MKTKFLFKSFSCMLAVIIILQIAPCSFAHTTSQKSFLTGYKTVKDDKEFYYIGGEDIGWSIDEELHTNGTKIYYTLSGNDITKYKDDISSAASSWSGIADIANKTGSVTGKIYTYKKTGNRIVAQTILIDTDKSGHLTKWEMKINLAYTVSVATIAHEFGHVIGLNDLYEPKNYNKLMCGYSNACTAIRPMTTDLWGAMVITGQHTNHQWDYKFYKTTGSTSSHIIYCPQCYGHLASAADSTKPVEVKCTYAYKFYGTSSQGVNCHVKYCTDCNKNMAVSNCTYNPKGICTECGAPKIISPPPYSIGDELE